MKMNVHLILNVSTKRGVTPVYVNPDIPTIEIIILVSVSVCLVNGTMQLLY